MMRLTDLREILHYVPRFRDRVFVIAIDGEIVASENFSNIMLDIALMRSLRVGVVLVHGASYQIRQLAARLNVSPSSFDGIGITDGPTLELATLAANRVTQQMLVGLAAVDLSGAASNAVVAHPAGILQGIDHQWTGRVERIDASMLGVLLKNDIVPVLAPLACDGENHTFRLNSDSLAVELARTLGAVKLIYLAASQGVYRNGELLRHLSVEEAEHMLKNLRSELSGDVLSKLEQAVLAAKGGVERVHIIDGRVQEGLLAEVFSNEGIGTLLHTNEYQAIRPATKKDIWAVYALLQKGMENDELLLRSRHDVERQIDDFFVYEIDNQLIGCAALHLYPDDEKAELASLLVSPRAENQGVGIKLMHYAEVQARAMGATELFCLSTQAVNFFVHKGGFRLGSPDDLPDARREVYERSGRRSQVLRKSL